MSETLLDKDTEDAVRLSVEDAHALGQSALARLGYTQENAAIVATHLVDASMWGYEFAGLPRILVIAERSELKHPCTPVSIVKESPVSALLDGGNNVGYVSLNRAAEIVIEKAGKSGVAVVGLRNSWFAGRNAYYLEKIARAGYAVIYFGSSTPTVVPPGAKKKALGTNPLAIALPGKVNPFIFDMGTASVMTGEILLKSFLGEEFPEIVGIDKEGTPTRVARELKEGGVFPFGGYKGFGLSLAIQALGLMAGSRMRNGEVSDFGYLFVAFDPGLLMPAEQFTSELEELLAKIKGLPRMDGVSDIRIPSERGFREREIRRRQGILVNKHVVERLRQICEAH
ncbi:Ldh family oxidoreductase [Candidimonas nitroreducens]|uniref:Lactate dehydrogenase n=1 Tax=Candidimonas nitroreducens TaxID=683354 RepID=A0A225MG09_9BURK|nr:Ldh family oxidoreductase [Candidimonas nitroreducens]OWT60296.1 lactate dehydrogenase [Candidimonas nitroreducens]